MSELIVREAEKTVRGIKVLDGVSLSCSSGQVVGLCGANGSGKTMLLRAITGLMYLDRGLWNMTANAWAEISILSPMRAC